MRRPVLFAAALLITVLGAAHPAPLHAQLARAPFPGWPGEPSEAAGAPQSLTPRPISMLPPMERAASRSATGTGLLIGGLVGAAATTIFLIGFCGDPDTACGVDEVGRAVVLIAVPCAAVGALIGSLVHTDG